MSNWVPILAFSVIGRQEQKLLRHRWNLAQDAQKNAFLHLGSETHHIEWRTKQNMDCSVLILHENKVLILTFIKIMHCVSQHTLLM